MAKSDVVAYLGIMSDMGMRQESAVITQTGFRVGFGAAMNGYIFSNDVAVSDRCMCCRALLIFEVLGLNT